MCSRLPCIIVEEREVGLITIVEKRIATIRHTLNINLSLSLPILTLPLYTCSSQFPFYIFQLLMYKSFSTIRIHCTPFTPQCHYLIFLAIPEYHNYYTSFFDGDQFHVSLLCRKNYLCGSVAMQYLSLVLIGLQKEFWGWHFC